LKDFKVPPNVGSLQELLTELDRWDVYDDLTALFEADAEANSLVEKSQSATNKGSEKDAITVGNLNWQQVNFSFYINIYFRRY